MYFLTFIIQINVSILTYLINLFNIIHYLLMIKLK